MGGFVFGSVAMATVARSKHPVILIRAGETEHCRQPRGSLLGPHAPPRLWR
ncbi:hypothetical protein [Streptomyces sp. NPDC019507]|uniref:hypothetical protein n=1 Tax=Streptomyces sp. NPDC019507 TaxID=3154689 RepID=UPI0033DFC33D